jgi:hypothetical protein
MLPVLSITCREWAEMDTGVSGRKAIVCVHHQKSGQGPVPCHLPKAGVNLVINGRDEE